MSVGIDANEIGLNGVAYTAGSHVAAGKYRRVDAPGRDVDLTGGGMLPASFDGRVAVYLKVTPFSAQAAA